MRIMTAAFGLALLTILPCRGAAARDVNFPIVLDPAFLRKLLVQQLYTGPGESAVVWRDDAGCTELVLRRPEVATTAVGIRVTSAFSGKLGAGLGQVCLGVSRHSGFVDLVLEPRLRSDTPVVEFRVVESQVLGDDRQKEFSGTLWDWVKGQVHPRLETFRVDLRRPVVELQRILPTFLAAEDATQSRQLLDSIRLAGVSSSPAGLAVGVRMDVPLLAGAPVTPAPEPTLTVAEVQRWEAAWHSWDAFLTFVIKRAGQDAFEPDVLAALRAVLLEARYDLIPALRPTSASQPDPVRPLFLKTWRRLQPVLRQLSVGVPGEAAVRYLSFVAAADALKALDQLGPEFGFEISAPGLRRLARTIDPASAEDPTRYSDDVDPDLRRLFGFGPPLEVPEIAPEDGSEEDSGEDAEGASADVAEELPTATPVAAESPAAAAVDGDRENADQTPLPPASPTPQPTLEEEFIDPPPRPGPPHAWWQRWSDVFVSPVAAAVPPNDFQRLHRWVPSRDELSDYLALVRKVLVKARQETLAATPIDAQFQEVYANLIFAAAWQETCWRQFVRVRKQVQTIASPVGAVGIMQVHSKVWRGFYNVDALKADIAYNARAGSEILRHYMIDYAVKKGEQKVRGDVHDLARAAYSAYNAGPRGLTRYRRPVGQKKGSIDAKFSDKYREVRAGNELAVASCYGGSPT